MTQLNEPEQIYTDSNGNLLAAVYVDSNDDLRIHHAASGKEAILKQDGTFDVPAVSTDDIDIDGSDLVSTGDFLAVGPSSSQQTQISTTSTSYVEDTASEFNWMQFDTDIPSGSQAAVMSKYQLGNSVGDLRLRNRTDSETVWDNVNVSTGIHRVAPTNYSPSTTGSPVQVQYQVRTNDGGSATNLDGAEQTWGVQL